MVIFPCFVLSRKSVIQLECSGWRGRSGAVSGRSPGASFGFYLREAFQSQTNTEKILYSNSR